MGEEIPRSINGGAKSGTARLEVIKPEEQLSSRGRIIPIQLIADALIKDGYLSLDAQAKGARAKTFHGLDYHDDKT